ncbi:MAG TPA: hypothetical protein VFE65_20320 [Pseudonocardia sp.]|nr:hypothetical protein [Pseudonocardia sp.]
MTAKTCSRVGPASGDPAATLIKDHGRLAEPKDWDEARTAAHAGVSPLPVLRVPLAQALGAVVAEGVHARVASPIADRSAMDGFAVCGPPPWRVVARLRAGERCDERLRPGTACEVVTGAPVPAATDAVLPYEQSSRDGSAVTGQIDRGRHIRRAGEECAAGEQVLSAGHLVTPATLGFVATLGRDTLPIHPNPVVQAFITGDELVHEGHAREGRVRDAIGPMLR